MNESNLVKFSAAWLVMWALSYFAAAVLAPELSGDPNHMWIFIGVGAALLVGVVFTQLSSSTLNLIGRVLLFLLGVCSVVSGVASWAGVAVWNVPFPDKALFQVSMAFADLLAAAFMFVLSLDKRKP